MGAGKKSVQKMFFSKKSQSTENGPHSLYLHLPEPFTIILTNTESELLS